MFPNSGRVDETAKDLDLNIPEFLKLDGGSGEKNNGNSIVLFPIVELSCRLATAETERAWTPPDLQTLRSFACPDLSYRRYDETTGQANATAGVLAALQSGGSYTLDNIGDMSDFELNRQWRVNQYWGRFRN